MALADLTHDLDAAEPRRRLAAAWDAFDLGQRAADAAAFTHGTDDIAALAAAAACATGRALLPLPSDGGPHFLPDADAPAVCAALLEQAAQTLDADARAASDAHAAADLHAASDRAREAAGALRRARSS